MFRFKRIDIKDTSSYTEENKDKAKYILSNLPQKTLNYLDFIYIREFSYKEYTELLNIEDDKEVLYELFYNITYKEDKQTKFIDNRDVFTFLKNDYSFSQLMELIVYENIYFTLGTNPSNFKEEKTKERKKKKPKTYLEWLKSEMEEDGLMYNLYYIADRSNEPVDKLYNSSYSLVYGYLAYYSLKDDIKAKAYKELEKSKK